MNDKEIIEIVFSYLDLKKIVSDNPGLSEENINVVLDRVKGFLKDEKEGAGVLHIFVDGASKGNPGRAGIGVAIEDEGGSVVDEYFEYIGKATNNVAEYRALIAGLGRAKVLNPEKIRIYSDSELIVKQVTGRYKVKNSQLIDLYWTVLGLLEEFRSWEIVSIPREKNKRADALANMGVDKGS